MYVFFCWGDGWLSRLISLVTKGPSHTGVGFEYKGSSTESDIFEALIGKGVRRKTLKKLINWALGNKKRRVEIFSLKDIAVEDMAIKRAVAETYCGTAGYAELQLLAMFLFEKFGRKVRKSQDNVVCSELVARLIAPEYDFSKERTFDEISPAFLYEKLRQRCVAVDEKKESEK